MKKIYLLFVGICCSLLVSAQVYLSEDFGAGTMPPTGWSLDGIPAQWSNSASSNAGGTSPEAKFSYVQQTTTTRLVSPIVDMTGVANVTLSFKYFYDHYANGPSIGVATRFGTSGAWNVVWQTTPSANQGPKTQVVDLTNIGQSDFQFCLFITGNLYNVDYWYIDDIKLFSPLALDAALASVKIAKYTEEGVPFNLEGTVSNEGSTVLNSFDINYTLDGGSAQVYPVTGVNVALGDVYNFTHNVPIVLSGIGAHPITVWINNVNGGIDLNPDNDTMHVVSNAVPFVPEKKVLAEEATGTWCGWCIRGICFMDYMAETYPDTWIGVAVHNGDPMVVTDYDGAMAQIIPGFMGYPSVTSDRTSGDSDPSDLEAGYQRRIEAISPATVEIVNYAWNPDTREVSFDLQSEFVADVNNELRFGVIFVEDSLWGTSAQWGQTNYYAGGSNGAMCGYENKPSTVPAADMKFDHVAREILDTPFGTPNSLPASITSGSVISYQYSYTLPDGWRYDKLHVVGFLLDMSTNEILNANNVISSYVGVADRNFENGIAVYPNPSREYTNVAFTLDNATAVSVDVCDLFGSMVYSGDVHEYAAGQNQIRISNASLANGMYVVRLNIGNQIITRKISVVK
ncbi:MAG TPA: hypothetical protein DCR43_00270 [Bacteroidales bacterium]|nr:hypothetical protein [Bacteroidales bacterium]HBZ67710.1 hypothetical protein [Bacteroidales bacterium]